MTSSRTLRASSPAPPGSPNASSNAKGSHSACPSTDFSSQILGSVMYVLLIIRFMMRPLWETSQASGPRLTTARGRSATTRMLSHPAPWRSRRHSACTWWNRLPRVSGSSRSRGAISSRGASRQIAERWNWYGQTANRWSAETE